MSKLSVLPLLVLATIPAAAPFDWEIVGSTDGSQPTARHEAAMVEFQGKFYLMGGRGSRPVDEFDPVTETWTEKNFPPIAMHHFQPVVFDGLVYVICAFEGGYPNETPVDHIYTYDPLTDDWDQGPLIPRERNRGAAGVVVYGDHIYVVGGNTQGHDGGFVAWTDRYDPVTDTWTELRDAPHARDHFVAAVIANKLYAGGGRQTTQPNPTTGTVGPVDVFDFSTGQWSSAPTPLPTERAGTMTVAREEHLLIIGGESGSMAHYDVEALDVNTGEWLVLPDLVDSRHGGGAVLYEDAAYVASGAGNNGGSPELTSQEVLLLTSLLVESEADLISNGDFDDGLAGWTDGGGASLDFADAGVGAPSVVIQDGFVTKSAAADFQETYTLTCVYEAIGSTGTASIGMEYLDANSNVVGSDKVAVANTTQLSSFTLTGTTPVSARAIRVELYADGDRTLRVDDVVVVETPAEVVRLGTPANPGVMQSVTGPVLGDVWDPAIDHTDFFPAAPLDFLAIGFAPANLSTEFGTVLLDVVLPNLLSGPAGVPFAIPLPLDPAFVGLNLYLQGVSVDGTDPVLTNALDGTLQAP